MFPSSIYRFVMFHLNFKTKSQRWLLTYAIFLVHLGVRLLGWGECWTGSSSVFPQNRRADADQRLDGRTPRLWRRWWTPNNDDWATSDRRRRGGEEELAIKEGDGDSSCGFPAETQCQETVKVTSVQTVAVSVNINVRDPNQQAGLTRI